MFIVSIFFYFILSKYNVKALNYKNRLYPISKLIHYILYKSSINNFEINKHIGVNSIIDISTGNKLWEHIGDGSVAFVKLF